MGFDVQAEEASAPPGNGQPEQAEHPPSQAVPARFIYFLNPDTELLPGSLWALYKGIDQDETIAAIGPQLRYTDGALQSNRRRFPGPLTGFFESTWLERAWPRNPWTRRYHLSDWPPDSRQDVDWLVGAALLVRGEVLAALGGFDPQFFMYSEETDLCRRIRRAGWRVVYDPAAIVIHAEGSSSGQITARRHILFNRSKVRYARKWHGPVWAALLRRYLLAEFRLQIASEWLKELLGHKRRAAPRARCGLQGRAQEPVGVDGTVSELSDAELMQVIGEGESDRVEFKESLSGSAAERIRQAICAFANDLPGHGTPGLVFLGVKDDQTIVGISATDRLLQQLANMKTDGNILPPPTLAVAKRVLQGREVALVIVEPSNSPPVRYKGAIHIRIGPRRGIATAQDERVLNEKRRYGDRPFDVAPVPTAGLADLNLTQFGNEYLPAAFSDEILAANDRTLNEQLAATKMIEAAQHPQRPCWAARHWQKSAGLPARRLRAVPQNSRQRVGG